MNRKKSGYPNTERINDRVRLDGRCGYDHSLERIRVVPIRAERIGRLQRVNSLCVCAIEYRRDECSPWSCPGNAYNSAISHNLLESRGRITFPRYIARYIVRRAHWRLFWFMWCLMSTIRSSAKDGLGFHMTHRHFPLASLPTPTLLFQW